MSSMRWPVSMAVELATARRISSWLGCLITGMQCLLDFSMAVPDVFCECHFLLGTRYKLLMENPYRQIRFFMSYWGGRPGPLGGIYRFYIIIIIIPTPPFPPISLPF